MGSVSDFGESVSVFWALCIIMDYQAQESGVGLSFLPGYLLNPEIEPWIPALLGGSSLPASH